MSVTGDTNDLNILHIRGAPFDTDSEFADIIDELTVAEKRNMLQVLEHALQNEKRHRHRKHQFIKTRVSCGKRFETGIIGNLSPGGAFLITPHFFPPGSEINLSFQVLNFEFPLNLSAEVIWVTSQGMGLRFKASQRFSCRLAAQKLADALELDYPQS